MTRRTLLAAAGGAALAQTASPRYIKGICSMIFPKEMPLEKKFREAKNAGFDAIELQTGGELPLATPADDLQRLAEAAQRIGIVVASIWCSDGSGMPPLNSDDPDTRAKGVEYLKRACEVASALRCGAMLVVPGRLGSGPKFRYGSDDTWKRVTAALKEVLPAAEKNRVMLTPENVWNKFLVSPLEMRAFVDQFKSPWFQSQFDTGNCMQYGYPQDWIYTLGPRIKRVHLKDYKLSARAEQGRFVDLLEGDVDWKEVMKAFRDVGYQGFMSPEYGPVEGDPDRIWKISKQADKILAMT